MEITYTSIFMKMKLAVAERWLVRLGTDTAILRTKTGPANNY